MGEGFYDNIERGNIRSPCKHHYAMVKLIESLKPDVFCDIGAGTGLPFKKLPTKSYAVEINNLHCLTLKSKGYKIALIGEDIHADVVFAGDVIEHIFDTDGFLQHARTMLKTDGKLIIATPNLAAWYNRISLLLGYQPVNAEVSTLRNAGHLLELAGLPAGHIRCMVWPALRELMIRAGFSDVTLLSTTLSSKLIAVGRKGKSDE